MKWIAKKYLTGLTSALTVLALSTGAAQAQSTWERIQETGTLRMGVTQAPPWYSKNPANGKWESGLIVSIGEAMADELDVELETVEVTWATAIAALQAEKIDMMFLDATPKRAMVVDYPKQPLLYISLAVLAKDDLEVTTWQDLNDPEVRVGVPQATSMDAFLTRTIPNADIQRFPDNGAAIAAFQSGRVDAVSLFHPPAARGAQEARAWQACHSNAGLQLTLFDRGPPGGGQDLPRLG